MAGKGGVRQRRPSLSVLVIAVANGGVHSDPVTFCGLADRLPGFRAVKVVDTDPLGEAEVRAHHRLDGPAMLATAEPEDRRQPDSAIDRAAQCNGDAGRVPPGREPELSAIDDRGADQRISDPLRSR